MALSTDNKAIIAFKHLLGKSQTDSTKEVGNEAEGIFFNIPSTSIFLDEIDSNPATAVSQGIALQVTADATEDVTSNGHAFFAEWPNPLPPGAPAGVSPGDRIINAISPSFGAGYEAVPKDSGATTIPAGDPRDWIYQYQSGVFFQQDNIGNDPDTIDLYVYVGQTLADVSVGGGGGSSEWQKSVFSRSDTPPGGPSIGDRYLVIATATGDWTGQEDDIAEWNGTEWEFTSPTDGTSVKVDDEDNAIYHYEGSTNEWIKEPLGQVRAGTATGLNNYSLTVSPRFDAYIEGMLFLVKFPSDNTGAVTIDINSLGALNVLKDDGTGSLIPLVAGDIKNGIVHYLVYDGTQLQLLAFAIGSGTTIGAAEDADYTDGLFTDFTPATLIGTAVDRFNEVLKSLAPPPAPDLSDWSGSIVNTTVEGNLSFDSGNPIASESYVGADIAPSDPKSVDELWEITGKRLGISSALFISVGGVLNDQVTAHPDNAYPANAFGDAEKGSLKLFINGVEVVASEADLTSTTSSIDTTAGATQSGFVLSAQAPAQFAGGGTLDLFQHRTGTWLVLDTDPNLVQGYNYVEVVHVVVPVTDERSLTRFEWIIDDNTVATTFSGENMDTLNMTGDKKLSGVQYHTGGSARYDVDIDNVYRNTFSDDGDAVSFIGNNNAYGTLVTAPSQPLGASSGSELLQINVVDKLVTIVSPNRRILNDEISITTQAKRTIQSTLTGGSDNIDNLLVDNFGSTSSNTIEDFNDEAFRLKTNVDYDLTTDVAANPWDPIQSIDDGSAGHTDGLQTIDGKLIYPGNLGSLPSNFTTSNIINGPVFNDGGTGGSARDYSSLSSDRTYYRYFRQVTPATANFLMNIQGSGGTFVPVTTPLTGNNIHFEMKAPSETGWMDCYQDFATGQFGDGDGARKASDGVGRAFNTTWGLTIGTKSTAFSDGYIVIRITVGDSFTGEFTKLTWTFN